MCSVPARGSEGICSTRKISTKLNIKCVQIRAVASTFKVVRSVGVAKLRPPTTPLVTFHIPRSYNVVVCGQLMPLIMMSCAIGIDAGLAIDRAQVLKNNSTFNCYIAISSYNSYSRSAALVIDLDNA